MNSTPNYSVTLYSIAEDNSDLLTSFTESFNHKSEKERAIRRMDSVISFIQNNFHRNINLKEIAAEMRLSPSRVSHLFKAAHNISIGQYLKQLKLQCAKRLLEDGSLTVKEVMARSGFNDHSHFTHDFKKAYGLRPSEYREAHRSNRFYNIELPGAAGFAKR